MGRIRTIKPEFPHSESIGRVSRDARLLFIELWTICDDSGRTRAASRMLASLLFPYDDDAPKQIDRWLSELEREALIARYCVDGSCYLQIAKWLKHQKIDKPTPSRLPEFVEDSPKPREDSPTDLVPRTIGSKNNIARFTSSEIESIYQEYPRKIGKDAALRKIRKALESIDDPTPVASLKAIVQAYARSPAGNNGEFTPHPATWFGQKRYLDDKKEWEIKR